MNGLRELSNINDLQLLCCRVPNQCKDDEICRGWRNIFFVFHHPPPLLTANIYCFPKGGG